MRKTIPTIAAALLLAVTGIYAASNTPQNNLPMSTITVKDDGLNSFCKAIVKGDLETVKKLIDLGEDVNRKSLGMTPAIIAARYNKAEILELLIANGANLKIRSDNGFTAKKYAEMSNAMEALAVINSAMEG